MIDSSRVRVLRKLFESLSPEDQQWVRKQLDKTYPSKPPTRKPPTRTKPIAHRGA